MEGQQSVSKTNSLESRTSVCWRMWDGHREDGSLQLVEEVTCFELILGLNQHGLKRFRASVAGSSETAESIP